MLLGIRANKGGAKLQHAQPKLYSISEKHPVAIMFLGTNFFINTPLKTIIQQFSATIDDTFYHAMVDYVNKFLQFIEELEMIDLYEESEENNYIISTFNNRIKVLQQELIAIKNTNVTLLEKSTHFEEMQYFLQRELHRLSDKSFLESFTEKDYEEINDTYGQMITELISERIADEEIIENFAHMIKDTVIQTLLKDILPGSTLVIFVGFGQNEMYPTVCELKIEGRVNRKLKYSYTLNKMTIKDVITSDIYSFAYSKLPIKHFMNSIDDRLEECFFHELHKQWHTTYQHIIESLADEVEAMEEFKRSEEHTSELQSRGQLVCRLLLY